MVGNFLLNVEIVCLLLVGKISGEKKLNLSMVDILILDVLFYDFDLLLWMD